jgi:hypothetical protein
MYRGPGLLVVLLVLMLLALAKKFEGPALVLVLLALVKRYGGPALVLVLVLLALVKKFEGPALVLVLVLVLLALVKRSEGPTLVLVPIEFYSKLLVYPSPPYRAQIENFALRLRSHLVLNGVSTFLNNLRNFVQNKLFFGFYLHIVHRYIYQPFAVPRK